MLTRLAQRYRDAVRSPSRARRRSRWQGLAAATLAVGLVTLPLAGVAAAVLYVVAAPRRRAYRDRAPLAWIGVFAGLSALLSPHRLDALLPWIAWLAIGTVLLLLAERWTREDAVWAGWGFAVAGLATLAWQVRQCVTLGQLRPQGFTAHPNLEGGLLLAVLGGVAVAWSLSRRRWQRFVLVVAFVGTLIAVVLTASRGAFVGLGAGALVALVLRARRFAWRRSLPWLVGAAVLVAAGLLAFQATRGAGGRNEIVGSGFRWTDLVWEVGSGSLTVSMPPATAAPSDRAVRLDHPHPGWQVLLAYRPSIAVHPGERLALSLWVRPAENALTSAFVRVEARSAAGAFVGRAGRTGWTTGDEGKAGGRMVLPAKPPGTWRRIAFILPPVPAGATSLRLEVADDGRRTGPYGEVTAVQLERGTAMGAYVPGPRPGLSAFFGPVAKRVLALQDPTQASGGRLSMWWFGVQLASYRPVLGYGPGSELRLVKQYALDYIPRPLAHLHSLYLKVLVEGGSVTLAALLVWLAITGWRLVVRARAGSSAAAIALASFVALLVHSAFDQILSQGYILAALWLVVCSGMYGREPDSEGEPSRTADGGQGT